MNNSSNVYIDKRLDGHLITAKVAGFHLRRRQQRLSSALARCFVRYLPWDSLRTSPSHPIRMAAARKTQQIAVR
jgi:hypothetical protein